MIVWVHVIMIVWSTCNYDLYYYMVHLNKMCVLTGCSTYLSI